MKSSPRDKVLMLVLPALLIAVGYVFLYYMPQKDVLDKQQKEFVSAQLKAPADQRQLLEMQMKLAQLNENLDRLNQDKQSLETRWQALLGSPSPSPSASPSPSPDRRITEKIERLTGLLTRHGLTVIEFSSTGSSGEAKLPAALEGVAKRLAEKSGNTRPPQYRLRLSGPYLSLLRVLEQLAEGEPLAIPISLTMKESDNGREWVLVVWI